MERTEVSSHLEKSEEAALCDSAPSSPSHPSTGASTPTLATANASPFADMLHSFIQRDDLAAVLGLQSNMYVCVATFSCGQHADRDSPDPCLH